MMYQFPDGISSLSLWRLACGVSRQNPIETVPTADTIDRLQEICKFMIANGGVEWATHLSPESKPLFRLDPSDAFGLIATIASSPERANWTEAREKLTLITVRREDWGKYVASKEGLRVLSIASQFIRNDYIVADFIPEWIAECEMPSTKETNRIVTGIKKWLRRKDQPAHDLSSEDIALIHEIWGDNNLLRPDAENPISEGDFEKYDQAFNSSAKKPVWFLLPTIEDANLTQNIIHRRIARDHTNKLHELIENGKANGGFDAIYERDDPVAKISLADARSYLKENGFHLVVLDQAEPSSLIVQIDASVQVDQSISSSSTATRNPISAKNEDGSWNRPVLVAEHDALKIDGSRSPTKDLAQKYGVTTTAIKDALRKGKAVAAVGGPAKSKGKSASASWTAPLKSK